LTLKKDIYPPWIPPPQEMIDFPPSAYTEYMSLVGLVVTPAKYTMVPPPNDEVLGPPPLSRAGRTRYLVFENLPRLKSQKN